MSYIFSRLIIVSWLFLPMPALGMSAIKMEGTIHKSLFDVKATSVYQDDFGYLWFGSNNGLFRYDGHEMRAVPAPGLLNVRINSIVEGAEGDIWVGTARGVFRIDAFRFLARKETMDCAQQQGCDVQSLLYHRDALWIGTKRGLLKRSQAKNHPASGDSSQPRIANVPGFENLRIFALLAHKPEGFLVGTHAGIVDFRLDQASAEVIPIGIAETGMKKGIFSLAQLPSGKIYAGGDGVLSELTHDLKITKFWQHERLNSRIWSMSSDGENLLWVGSLSDGLFRLDIQSGDMASVRVMDKFGLKMRSVKMVSGSVVDRNGDVWVTTDTGNFLQLPRKKQNITYLDNASMDSLVKVHAIFEKDDILYYSNLGDGVSALDSTTGRVIDFKALNSQLSDKNISSIHQGVNDDILLGTYRGVAIFSLSDKILRYNETLTSGGKAILNIFADSSNRVWKGAHSELGYFEDGDPFRYKILVSDAKRFFVSFIEYNGTLLVGASDGVYRYNAEGHTVEKLVFSNHVPSDRLWVTDFQLSEGRLLVGTRNGLKVIQDFDASDPSIRPVIAQSLFDNYEIVASYTANEDIYALTTLGLLRYNKNTNNTDVLNHFEYNFGSFHRVDRAQKPSIYVGSEKGISHISPILFAARPTQNLIKLTGIQLDGKSLDVHDVSTEDGSYFSIPYQHDSLSLHFSNFTFDPDLPLALEYRRNAKGEWVSLGEENKITFHAMSPGAHEIVLRHRDGKEDPLRLNIYVDVPWWQSTPAKIAYALVLFLVFSLSVIFFSRLRNRIIIRKNIELEKGIQKRTQELEESSTLIQKQAGHLEQLIKAKDELFVNLTHELKTPLSLILCPLDLVKSRTSDKQSLELIELAELNGNRLLRDINQLLDIDNSALTSTQNFENHDLSSLTALYVSSFSELLAKKHIVIEKRLEPGIFVQCLPEMVEKIVINLMSNLLKYAPNSSAASVTVSCSNEYGVLKVSNGGSFIPEEKRAIVFHRFTRLSQHRTIFGTGIGLALVKQLSEAMGGYVSVDSSRQDGTSFFVYLPLSEKAASSAVTTTSSALAESEASTLRFLMPGIDALKAHQNGKPGLLIIEDNKELAQCLAIGLQSKFNIMTAYDGSTGLKYALDNLPDLVITDIGLPEKDGLEVCGELKGTSKTMHIPVIVLTADGSTASRTAAWELLADEFIEKPFDWTLLERRIDNLLKTRDKIKRKMVLDYVINEHVETTENQLPSPIKDKVERIKEVISKNYSSSDFGPEALANAIGMSKRNLTRQAKELIGTTPMEYIKAYRLKQSKVLLVKGFPVTRVSEEVGIKSHSQFSRAFKGRYGVSPSAFQRQESSKTSN